MGQTTEKRITRLAPSPTGALHLGNLRTFLVNWVMARQQGWQIAFRIDDLDSPRVKAGADREATDILRWIGLDWDTETLYESQLELQYRRVLIDLAHRGLIYPCRCTRLQIQLQAASAPHRDQHELCYPGTCCPANTSDLDFDATDFDGAAWRFRLNNAAPTEFTDEFAGPQRFVLSEIVGDFLVANRERQPVYQLAVVLDDAYQGVTDIVRGDDLLSSTPRQMILQQALKLPVCRYWHLPLVVGSDGRRLAKRHGDTRIAWYREQGVRPERLLGLMAQWCGLASRREITLTEWVAWFDLSRLPRQPIEFTVGDHDWLLASSSA